ncbi:BON domain-containing protein [Cognatiyoonia koreensis]|uniref:Small-conductance mechanosensitive channel n=1 Tax=Cognatiyoonia koreensis TaxID=364200 RepID=A0A1I0MSF1_9RHOB|nr:mechanosensitive ion channel domain-containing protein [Cognatiyoonia koreensis]SEV91564.1 BON domain-containing protein [Cognatiyoonia koreensis]
MRFLLLIPLLLTLAMPALAQEANGPIGTENTEQMDADIATRIREIVRELGNYEDVTVSVSEGIVTMRGTANSALEAAELTSLANRIEGVVAVKNEVTETTDVARRLDPAIDRFQARLDQVVVILPLMLIALAAFIVVVLVGFALARLKRPWDRIAPNAFVADIYRQLVRLAFVIFGIVIALDIMNATALLSTILGAAGIIGLAIGFAVRDTVENFIASVMLSFRQPFRPNDTVEINGDQGKVIRLTSRATILLSFDGNHIRIPNATVFKSRIINFTQNAERRFMFNILIARGTDLQNVRQLMEETVQSLPFVLDTPAASVWIETLEPAGTTLVVTGWINQNETSITMAKGEAIRQVKLAVQNAGVVIADSSQVVVLERGDDDAVSEPQDATETTDVIGVDAAEDMALEDIIQAERQQDASEDLLRDDALKE